nr:hypothetical protein [Pandoravirus massiliensis]
MIDACFLSFSFSISPGLIMIFPNEDRGTEQHHAQKEIKKYFLWHCFFFSFFAHSPQHSHRLAREKQRNAHKHNSLVALFFSPGVEMSKECFCLSCFLLSIVFVLVFPSNGGKRKECGWGKGGRAYKSAKRGLGWFARLARKVGGRNETTGRGLDKACLVWRDMRQIEWLVAQESLNGGDPSTQE